MFSKAKTKQNAEDKAAKSVQADITQSSSPAPSKRSSSMKPAGVPSIISADVVMRGNINAAVIMIAEKAADLVRGRPAPAPEHP